MKINDFASEVTRREGGEKQLTVAQVSEVLRIVNAMLWGVPYLLIRAKGNVSRFLAWLLAGAASVAAVIGVSHVWRLHEKAPEPAKVSAESEDCGGNTRPKAVMEIRQDGKVIGNNKGFVVEGALVIGLLVSGFLLFVPNPISSATGIGVRPNKTIEREQAYERVELLKDEKGNPVLAQDGAYLVKKSGANSNYSDDKQQRVTLFESLVSLPRLLILGIIMSIIFPASGVGLFMRGLYNKVRAGASKLRGQTSQIVKGVKRGLDAMPTAAVVLPPGAVVLPPGSVLPAGMTALPVQEINCQKEFLSALSKTQDQETEDLVKDLLKGT